ncbi:MAG: hypothetical protein JXQ76_01525 [Campylobacterales bacterium]|nr:hypothetical protein [Campylobacterales bacterium]
MINISQTDFESIEYYAKLYKSDYDTIVHEALKLYFETQEKARIKRELDDAQKEINLDYNEFWDGVEID